MVKVCKFGGSSLADAKQFKKVRDIVLAEDTRRIVVVSAPGKRNKDDNKITDLLYLSHAHLKYGVSYENVFNMIELRYYSIAKELGLKLDLASEFSTIRSRMHKGMSIDYLASRGEYLSALLMAEYLGFTFVDAADWVKFDYDGKVKDDETAEALQNALDEYGSIVVPGFYGSLPNGDVKVMPRGGSDITGAIAAASVGADLYENWTDVSGILMADPRIVNEPKPILHLTYAELRELSHMGADVLHEETVLPVRAKDITLNIRNTNAPEAPGTLIQECFLEEEPTPLQDRFITGISGRRNFSIIAVYKTNMSGQPQVVQQVLEVFERQGVGIELILGGIDSVSVVTPSDKVSKYIYDIIAEIKTACEPDDIVVTDKISLITAVGRKMALRPGISGKLFATLGNNDINIRVIAQGPDEINITVGVMNDDFEKTIRVLYDSFVS